MPGMEWRYCGFDDRVGKFQFTSPRGFRKSELKKNWVYQQNVMTAVPGPGGCLIAGMPAGAINCSTRL